MTPAMFFLWVTTFADLPDGTIRLNPDAGRPAICAEGLPCAMTEDFCEEAAGMFNQVTTEKLYFYCIPMQAAQAAQRRGG